MPESIDSILSHAKQLCDTDLSQTLENKTNLSPRLKEACHYSLFAGGKRIRPALCFALAKSLNKDIQTLIPIASALECIHTYSLIHDDLPAMDNDDLRRGKPTSHIAFDEATAILAGDALLTLAFERLTDPDWDIPAQAKVSILACISQKAGANGMVGGQMLDLQHENNPSLSHEQLQSIHLNKTAALLEASLLAPAMAYNLDTKTQGHLQKAARSLGLAFQVADDILDVTQSSETLGKNANSDLENNKSTYPSIHGLEKSKQMMQDLYQEALQQIDHIQCSNGSLKALAQFIIERKS